MMERSYLNLVNSLIEGQDCLKLAKHIDSLSDVFDENHLWEADQLSLGMHLNEVRRIKRVRYKGSEYFDYSKENEIIVRVQQGDSKARNEVIHNHLLYVIQIAKKYQNLGLPLNDLIEEGYIGLITALGKHDASRGFSFRTYARHYIINSILTAINKYGTLIHYPMNVMAAHKKVQKYIDQFQMKYGGLPDCEDIEKDLKLEDSIVDSCCDAIPSDISLDDIFDYLDDYDLFDSLINSSIDRTSSMSYAMETDEDLKNESLAHDVDESLSQLFDRESEIIRMFYGIGCREYSFEEIAKHFGLSKERIRQIEEKAIRRLKGGKTNHLRNYMG